MEYLYLPQTGDKESILENLQKLQLLSNEDLISDYNKQVDIGVVGVRAQMLLMIALHQTFLKRFRKSPIKIVDNCVFSLSGKISYQAALKSFIKFEPN